MTGNLIEHTPDPQPLIQRYYEALGFSEPGAEYDPSTGTYQHDRPWPSAEYISERVEQSCCADPEECARWTAELMAGPDVELEAS